MFIDMYFVVGCWQLIVAREIEIKEYKVAI